VLVVAIVLLWSPVLKPAGQAAILIGDIFSEQLIGTNLAAAFTPEPRMAEGNDSFAGTAMRVTYWRPGWGDRHPAIMIVPGAAPRGNDEPTLRSFGLTLSRAGYLVMLPEFPFLKEGRFDSAATRQLDAAFARARTLPETQGLAVGAFGVSVGAGMMLVAAAREPALRDAAFLAVLACRRRRVLLLGFRLDRGGGQTGRTARNQRGNHPSQLPCHVIQLSGER